LWTPKHKELLQVATSIHQSKNRKSQAQFGFVPPLPTTYSIEALQMGYQVEQATGSVLLNPHAVNIQSLVDVDIDWLTDRAIFLEWLDYGEENAKIADFANKVSKRK
jgi:hypothetical protein